VTRKTVVVAEQMTSAITATHKICRGGRWRK